MMARRPDCPLEPLGQVHLDWLLRQGVTTDAMIKNIAMMVATGSPGPDGKFDHEPDGDHWLAFEEDEDFVFWKVKTGEIATWDGRAFALGQDVIGDPWTYSFDCSLNLFPSPLQWLQAKRDGIVVLDWSRAFDRLRDCPRVAVAESLLLQFRRHMKPPHFPEILVTPERRIAA